MVAASSDAAGAAFVSVLQEGGLPECLWDALLKKIQAGDLGTRGALKAVPPEEGAPARVTAARRLSPASDVFLVPHVVSATRPQLQRWLADDAELASQSATVLQLLPDTAADSVFKEFFAWAQPSPPESGASFRALTAWHLLPKEALWLRHSETAPNVHVVPLPDFIVAAIGAESDVEPPPGASLLWPSAPVQEGDEVTRDWLPGGNKSLQRAAVLLALLEPPGLDAQASKAARWASPQEHAGLTAAVEGAAAGALPPGLAGGVLPRRSDTRPPQDRPEPAPKGAKLRVHFAYPGAEKLLSHPSFEATGDAAAADILWHSSPVRDFLAIPTWKKISQFPYEGALVRKDLLPATLRRLAAAGRSGSGGRSSGSGGAAQLAKDLRRWHPPLLPAAYDLATEPHFFLADYRQRADAGTDNHWVVKPAQGTRSADACVTDAATTVLAYRAAPGGDRVVQKYISQPVTWRGRKFDLRVYVAVRSFEPLDAFLFTGWYARAANKEYGLGPETLADFETHFTVSCYEEVAAVREAQTVVSQAELAPELAAQGVEIAALQRGLADLARSVLMAGATQIGRWPHSRAIYGLDVMLESRGEEAGQEAGSGGAPRLLEVNSSPDFGLVSAQFPDFLNDAFAVLFLDGAAAEPPPSFLRL